MGNSKDTLYAAVYKALIFDKSLEETLKNNDADDLEYLKPRLDGLQDIYSIKFPSLKESPDVFLRALDDAIALLLRQLYKYE